jgi:hypothetical protein
MANATVINLDDVPVTIEKRSRDRPQESKNKSKIGPATLSSTTPAKRHRGRPLGSRNKKSSTATAGTAALLDVSLAQPILPQSSA